MIKGIIFSILIFFISIAPVQADNHLTVEQVISHVQEQWTTVEDVALFLVIEHYNETGDLTAELRGRVLANKEAQIIRLEVTEPDILADQVYVLDEKAGLLKIYMPVNEQIMVSTLENAAENQGFELDLERLAQLPDPSLYHMEILRVEDPETAPVYVIEVRAKEEPATEVPGYQVFWVDGTHWYPTRIEAFTDGGNLLGVMEICDVVFNEGLSRDELAWLPEDAFVIGP
ncbi:MAG: hypothetical protein ACOYD6_02015 [Limnochordia bacterium]